MSDSNEQTPPGLLIPANLAVLKENWGWMLALGILFVLLGSIGLGMTFYITMASMLFFGTLLLIGGGFQLAHLFKCRGWKSLLSHLLIALLYIAAGVAVINNPERASSVLTLLLAWSFIAIGILRVFIALQHRGVPNWFWTLIGGLLSLLIGGMIIAEWPESGLWIIGLFIAVEMLVSGWSYIFLALAARRMASKA